MTGATDPDGIAFAELGDAIDPVSESSVQASSIQNALNNRKLFSYRWASATDRTNQQNMGEGDFGYQTDTDTPYVYCGLNIGWMPFGYGTGKQFAGSLLVTPKGSSGDFLGRAQISFPPGYFTAQPAVLVTPYTSKAASVDASADQVTSAGFIIQLHRSDSATATTVFYFAVQAA